MTCVDKNCGDCTGDSTKCLGDGIKSSCYDGYYRQDDGKCVNCDIATGSGDQSEANGQASE